MRLNIGRWYDDGYYLQKPRRIASRERSMMEVWEMSARNTAS